MLNVVVTWHGLPPYAISQLSSFSRTYGSRYNITIVVTLGFYNPSQQDLDSIPGLIIINPLSQPTFESLGITKPDILFLSGYRYRVFSRLHRSMLRKSRPIVCMSDSNSSLDIPLSLLRALYFRLFIARSVSAFLVPGREGQLLLRFYGFSKAIKQGMYGADPQTFSIKLTPRLVSDRLASKTFLFVGRHEPIKGLDILIKCFRQLSSSYSDWKLVTVGGGSLVREVDSLPNAHCTGHLDTNSVARLMSQSTFFILPSKKEPWGVVVHEAASCGLPLLLSSAVGSAIDLANKNNSIAFHPYSSDSLYRALEQAITLPLSWHISAARESKRLSSQFGPSVFSSSLHSFIGELCQS